MRQDGRLATAKKLPAFPAKLGIELIEITAERVVGQLLVTEALANRNGVLAL